MDPHRKGIRRRRRSSLTSATGKGIDDGPGPRDAGEGGTLGPEVELGAAVLVGGLGAGVGALVAKGTASEQWEAVPISASSAPVARGGSEGARFH